MSTPDPTSSRRPRDLRERLAARHFNKSLRTTWTLPILASVFAALAIVGVHFTSVDIGGGHRMLADLHELQALQTRCEREFASVDVGDPAQRAAILSRLSELEGRWRLMASSSRPVGISGRAEADELGAAYGAALAAKRKRMEEYVAERAAYERACALLPDVVLDLINRAPKLSRSPDVQTQLDEVLSRVAAGELAADPVDESKLDLALAGLKRLRGRFALEEAAVLERLTNHIVYMQLKATAMRTLRDEMHRTRLDDIGHRLFATYNESLGERSARANQLRLTAYALAALLIGGLVYGMYRRRKSVESLAAVHANVDELVRARTEQLTKTNRELALEVAERRRAELDAEKARDAAVAASRTKSEFLANMSHEIRTPMTAIIGFSESLAGGGANPVDRAEAINTIRRNGEHLLQIIDDILDTSRIEAGKLEIERVGFSPHEAVAEVVRVMAPKAEAKGIAFDVVYGGPIPRTIVTDPVRLKQVLLNLVGNAIKFTVRGSVTLRVECARPDVDSTTASQPSASMVFTVRDTGIGMTPEQMERLFRPFSQAESSTTRAFGGTGLGLSICKHLVELMHGAIQFESELGVGSRFSFKTEVGPIESAEWVEPSSSTLAQKAAPLPTGVAGWPALACRVLLAEDAQDSTRLIVHVLKSAGATVTAVGDGQTACDLALEAKRASTPFDVVLMDMQMPVLDGYRAVKSLRDAGYEAPIVALTASATTAERQRCVEAGCDAFCAKPIDWSDLLATIARLVSAREADAPQEAAALAASAPDAAAVAESIEAATTVRAPAASVGDVVTSLFPGAEEDEGLVELMRMFVDDLSNDMLSMRLALQSGEMEIIATLAHQLKGTAGSYGFPAITEQAARVEECVRNAAPSEDVQRAIAVLQDLCMQVQTRGGKLFPGSAAPERPAA